MAQTHKNQKGFSVVETILVVIVVVLIAVAGWLVYKNNHKKTENKTATNTTQTKTTPTKTTTPTDTTPQPHVVKMPELGVQFTLPANVMTDFKYIVQDVVYPQFNNAKYPTALLGTKQLDDMGCVTTDKEGAAPALGFFTKTPGQYPASANVDNSTGALAKQFSDFYISFRPRGFACFQNNPQGDQMILDQTAQVKEAAKSLELIK